MADDLAAIEQLAAALLRNVAPPQRRTLLRQLAREGQQANRKRIQRQVQPDGTPFEPRRAKPSKKGRIRRQAMFRKLRLARHLAAGATADEAWFGFSGNAARVARVHQEGLEDAPAPGQKRVRYARRVLIDLSEVDRERIMDLLLERVTAGA